jgi:cystathionine beta-lyase
MSDAKLREFFIQRAKLGMNPGVTFGKQGSGFMRLNMGSSRAVIREALQRMDVAVKTLQNH